MDQSWRQAVLALAEWETEVEAIAYCDLVYEAQYVCDLDDARALMRTFTAREDYGVQECVVTVLASAPIEVYQQALLEYLPTLSETAPEWAKVLVGREVHFYPDPLASMAQTVDESSKNILLNLLSEPDFDDFYSPNATEIARRVVSGQSRKDVGRGELADCLGVAP